MSVNFAKADNMSPGLNLEQTSAIWMCSSSYKTFARLASWCFRDWRQLRAGDADQVQTALRPGPAERDLEQVGDAPGGDDDQTQGDRSPERDVEAEADAQEPEGGWQ